MPRHRPSSLLTTTAAAAAATFLFLSSFITTTHAVHYFTGLDSLEALNIVGLTHPDGTLVKNTLIGFTNPRAAWCMDRAYALGFPFAYHNLPGPLFEMAQVLVEEEEGATNELLEFFGVQDPQAACGRHYVYYEAGSKLESQGHVMDPQTEGELEDWFWNFQSVPQFTLTNDLTVPVSVSWESRDEHMTERRVMELQPGQDDAFGTFLGHTLIFRDLQNANRLLARATITTKDGITLSHLLAQPTDIETHQVTDQQVSIWRGRLRTNLSRLRQNERQPPTVRRFTDVGFKKIKIPNNTYNKILEFYMKNEGKRINEGWNSDDLHVNFYETMTTVVHLDAKTRDLVYDTMKPVLEAWIGGEKLEPTSTYGIRRYYNGSVLRDHVDIGETHVVSAILNIGQDVDKPWPLQIIDQEGRRHFVEMTAGEMCLYESATAIHGRTQPLNGRIFDNIFTHFRPVNNFKVGVDGEEEEWGEGWEEEEWGEDEEEEEGEEGYFEDGHRGGEGGEVVEDVVWEDGSAGGIMEEM